MKVLKHGCFIEEAKCERCGCEFEYNDFMDIKYSYKDDRKHILETKYVECPECGAEITLKEY